MPYVTLAVPAGMPVDFAVLLDGLPVAPEQWGTRLPLDPGKHEITASGTKLRKFSQTIELRRASTSASISCPSARPAPRCASASPDAPSGTLLLVDGQPRRWPRRPRSCISTRGCIAC